MDAAPNFSANESVLHLDRPDTVISVTPFVFNAWATFSLTSPLPTNKIRLSSSLPKIRFARLSATVPILTCPREMSVWVRINFPAWKLFSNKRIKVSVVGPLLLCRLFHLAEDLRFANHLRSQSRG